MWERAPTKNRLCAYSKDNTAERVCEVLKRIKKALRTRDFKAGKLG